MKKSKRKSAFLGIAFLTALLAFLVILWASNFWLQVVSYEISSEDIPEGFRGFKIALISDLHSMSFGHENSSLLKKLDREGPDILVMAGDMLNSNDRSYQVFYQLAQDLAEKYPCYFIVGNHEQALEDKLLVELLQKLAACGVTVLDNQPASLYRGSDQVNLYGMWFNLRYYRDAGNPAAQDIYFDLADMEKVLGQAPKGFNILLTHNPVYFSTYAQWGADLTLSGHIHGGVVRLPCLGGVFSPEREFFPQYSSGLYYQGSSILLVSRGLGNGSFGLRFLNRPELSVITL